MVSYWWDVNAPVYGWVVVSYDSGQFQHITVGNIWNWTICRCENFHKNSRCTGREWLKPERYPTKYHNSISMHQSCSVPSLLPINQRGQNVAPEVPKWLYKKWVAWNGIEKIYTKLSSSREISFIYEKIALVLFFANLKKEHGQNKHSCYPIYSMYR